ncbi:MAG: DUF3794 domain-containing protein [Limnochordaceae bacterium]|nr:DUF3794 domain-containing protein [Limnochordaceae bacterium]
MTLKLDETSLTLRRVDGEETVSALASGEVRLGLGEPEIGRVLSLRALPRLGPANWNEGQAQATGLVDLVLIYESGGQAQARRVSGSMSGQHGGEGQETEGQGVEAGSEGGEVDAGSGASEWGEGASNAGKHPHGEKDTEGKTRATSAEGHLLTPEDETGAGPGDVLESSVWRDALQFEAWAELNLQAALERSTGASPVDAEPGKEPNRETRTPEGRPEVEQSSGSAQSAVTDGAIPVELRADCRVESIEYQVDEDGRGLQVEVSLSVTFRATHQETIQLVTGVSAGTKRVHLEGERAVLEQLVGQGQASQTVRGHVPLDTTGHPAARRLLDVRPVAAIERSEAGSGSVEVQGTIRLAVLYVPIDASQGALAAAFWPTATKWSAVIPVAGTQPGHKPRPKASIGGFDAALDDDGRGLEFALELEIQTDVVALTNLTLLESVDGDGIELAVATNALELEALVGETTSQVNLQQELEVGEPLPGVEHVLLGEGQIRVDRAQCRQDQVQVEGSLDLEMFYMAGGWEATPEVVSWPKGLEFGETLVVPGVHAGDTAKVEAQVVEVQLVRRNSRVVSANVSVQFSVRVVRPLAVDGVTDVVEIPPLEEDPPALRFVLLQPGDTLWRLATRYRTTVEGLKAENPWISTEGLKAGRKVCIPQRILVRNS